jgi:ankyrin repeat protein
MRRRQFALIPIVLALGLLSVHATAASRDSKASGQALLSALRDADEPRAIALIDRHADVNSRDETGTTPLAWAAQRRSLDLLRRLLEAGANPNSVSENGLGPLQIAISNHSTDIALLLLDKGARANVARDNGETALMTAARTSQLEVMRRLIARGADVNAREEMFHQTALMWSADYPEQVKLLIAHGADVRARTKAWDVTNTIYTPPVITIGITGIPWNHSGEYVSKKGGQNALFFAVQKHDLESVRILLDAGVDPNEPAADGSTALLLALYKWGYAEMYRPNAEVFRLPSLPFEPNLRVANLLLDRGAKVNVADAAGYTPLHGAVLGLVTEQQLDPPIDGEPERDASARRVPVDLKEGLALIIRLLELQADPNAQTRYPTPGPIGAVRINPAPPGSSPLHVAALSGNTAVMEVLIARGGDPNRLRQDGHSPLSVAVKADDLPMAKLLVAHGGNVKQIFDPADSLADPVKPIARPRTRQTILHIAAAAGAYKVIPFLAEQGAPLQLRNGEGETLLELADAQERFRYVRESDAKAVNERVGSRKAQGTVTRQTNTTDTIKQLMNSRTAADQSASSAGAI